MLRTTLCLTFLCLAACLYAQVARFRHFTEEQGLPSSLISCMLQDREGFLWIGTANGLCRYDGYTFKMYRYDPGDPHSIASNTVEAIYEDRAGTLWFGHSAGVSRFDKRTEQFKTYSSRTGDAGSVSEGPVSAFYEDAKGRFWVATFNGDGIQELDRERGVFRKYSPRKAPAGADEVLFTSPMLPRPGCADCFWIAFTEANQWKLYSFNAADKTFTPYPADSIPPMSYIWNVFQDADGQAWFATSRGLLPFDANTGSFKGYEGLPADFLKMRRMTLMSASIDASGQIWLATYREGIYALDKKKGVTAHYRHEEHNPNSLSSNAVKAVLRDRSGIIWAGAASNALDRITLEPVPFRHFRPGEDIAGNFTANSILAMHECRDGKIWLGTENTGVLLFDPVTSRIERAEKYYPELTPLRNLNVVALCESREGKWWIGTNSMGLYCFDPVRRSVQSYRHDSADPGSLSADYINTLIQDRAGNLWVGTYRGIDRFDPAGGQFRHYYLADPNSPALAEQNVVNHLYEDRSGNIWACTFHGIALLDANSGGFRHFLRKEKGDGGLKPLYINAILQGRSGAYWAGTANGLYRLIFPDPADPRKGTPSVRRYTAADGLPDDHVLCIGEDSRGRLWLNTVRGVTVFRNPQHDDRTPADFKTYDERAGAQNNAIMRCGCLKSRRGAFYFGGRTGFDVASPDSIYDSAYRPPVRITSIEKFNTDQPEAGPVVEKGVYARGEVVLSYKNNIFTIEFAALDFREPGNNRYAYRMLGFNDAWVQLGAQRRVTFTNLAPGTYIFDVRGTNSDGIWNETPASLKIIITPPWWKTVWAYALYVLLLIAALAGFVRARVRFLENRNRELERAVALGTAQILEQKEKLEKQADELKELDRLKSRFYANVTHELRTPLTLMLGPLNSVLENWNADPEHYRLLKIARENGRKLLDLVSELLDLGKLDANRMSVDKQPVAVKAFFDRLVAQFDSHAQFLGIRLECRTGLPPDFTAELDAKKFATVVNNLLSNALRFTPSGGVVAVALSGHPGSLLLEVRDSGHGIHPDDLPHIFDRYYQTKRADAPVEGGTGIGLALCAELTRLCGGRIWAESSPGAGSVFRVEWPAVPVESLQDRAASGAYFGNAPANFVAEPVPARSNNTGTSAGEAGQSTPADAPVRILIAEDNPDLQAYLHQLLAPEYDVILARDGEAALDRLDALFLQEKSGAGVDLIISDIMMPRMDGFQLLDRLKNDDRYRHIPVVMLTARTDIGDKLRALRAGVDDYLTKPFEEEELLARVRNLASRRLHRKEAAAHEPALSRADAEWLSDLEVWTRAHLHDEFFSVGTMARHAALSERQLLRRMRELTGLSPQQYIGELRLQMAREALEQGVFRSVAEAAYAAGFGNAKAFSRAYRERFGRLPSSYF